MAFSAAYIKALHLEVQPAFGFGFPFQFVLDLSAFFCYVWILEFLLVGSDATTERLHREMCLLHTDISPYLFNIGTLLFYTPDGLFKEKPLLTVLRSVIHNYPKSLPY